MKVSEGLVSSKVPSLDSLWTSFPVPSGGLSSGCVCTLITSFYKDTSPIGLGTTIWPHVPLISSRPCLLNLSHFEVLGVRTWTWILGDAIQPITTGSFSISRVRLEHPKVLPARFEKNVTFHEHPRGPLAGTVEWITSGMCDELTPSLLYLQAPGCLLVTERDTIFLVQGRTGLWLPPSTDLYPHASQAHDDPRNGANVCKTPSPACGISKQFPCLVCKYTEAAGNHFGETIQEVAFRKPFPNSALQFSWSSVC